MNLLQSHAGFTGPANFAQFARDGAWETAWRVDPSALPTEDDLQRYLGASTEVAVELFFGAHFFGARRVGAPAAVLAFARSFLDMLRSAGGDHLPALARSVQRIPVAGAPIAFAEIGCVNAWRSVGALRLGAPRAALRDADATWAAVCASAPARDERHPKAIEFAFAHETPYWFGVPISEPAAPWRISRDALFAALQTAAHGP